MSSRLSTLSVILKKYQHVMLNYYKWGVVPVYNWEFKQHRLDAQLWYMNSPPFHALIRQLRNNRKASIAIVTRAKLGHCPVGYCPLELQLGQGARSSVVDSQELNYFFLVGYEIPISNLQGKPHRILTELECIWADVIKQVGYLSVIRSTSKTVLNARLWSYLSQKQFRHTKR